MTPETLLEPKQSNKPENVPEKFWDEENQTIRMEALLESYKALEAKLSNSLPAANDEEGRAKVMKALGVPENGECYDVDCSHGLFEPDMELNTVLHENGFTPAQVQVVYDMAAEKLVPLIMDLAGEFEAEREMERLVEHFGGPEKWREISRQLLKYGQTKFDPEVLKGLASSFDGVMALFTMMKSDVGDSNVNGTQNNTSDGMNEKELQAMMRDPKYWRDRDPELIEKVTKAFESMYS